MVGVIRCDSCVVHVPSDPTHQDYPKCPARQASIVGFVEMFLWVRVENECKTTLLRSSEGSIAQSAENTSWELRE